MWEIKYECLDLVGPISNGTMKDMINYKGVLERLISLLFKLSAEIMCWLRKNSCITN